MAIFHASIKALGRRAGRSAVAAAAYRAGVKLVDQRTGAIHDFTRRRGVLWAGVYAPEHAPVWASDRRSLWNAAELGEVRSDARTAREFEVALPAELSPVQRLRLAQQLAHELVAKHRVAVDLAMHAPGRKDSRNFHAHLLITTRELTADGLGRKTRELDDRKTGPALVEWWRERWAQLVNFALERAGRHERVDHRSLAAQGIDRAPQVHLGPHAISYEARTGLPSRRSLEGEARAIEFAASREALVASRAAMAAARQELADELATTQVAPTLPSLAALAAHNQSAAARAARNSPPCLQPPNGIDYE